MENYLLKLEGYFFKDVGRTSEEDLEDFEGKLLDFLKDNGYLFVGITEKELDE